MKKRRRLADKLMIMMCAVLIAVSAFFYAPMEVSAEESFNVSSVQTLSVDEVMTTAVASEVGISNDENLTLSSGYWARINSTTSEFSLASGLVADSVYKVDLTLSQTITPSKTDTGAYLRSYSLIIGNTYDVVNANALDISSVNTSTVNRTYYLTGEFLMASRTAVIRGVVTNSKSATFTLDFDYNITVNSITEVSNSASDEYQDGYNAGYSDGQDDGYDNGYSDGFAEGESSGFDSGYQQGQDSVDTDSYYDAGYQAGYDAAYSIGYDDGYADAVEEYAHFMDFADKTFSNSFRIDYNSSIMDREIVYPIDFDFDLNSEYNIAFDVSRSYTINNKVNVSGTPTVNFYDLSMDFCGFSKDLNTSSIAGHYSVDFIPSINDPNLKLSFVLSSIIWPSDFTSATSYIEITEYVNIKNLRITKSSNRTTTEILEDMEKQDRDTQGVIQDGFSDAMNGFDNSQGNSVNSDLSSGLDDYQTVEDSLWATATTGLKDFTFFDFASVPAMITGMSFITAIMGSWFNHAGGASGVGIVLSILFSVILVSMVLGLYRWYQSRGGKD